jgi:hypothetical protein
MCCGEDFHRLGVQGVEVLILVGASVLLDRGGEKKERKINHCGEGGFPQIWTRLAGCALGHSC